MYSLGRHGFKFIGGLGVWVFGMVVPAWAGSAQNIITHNPDFATRDSTARFQQPRYWRCKWPGDTTNNWWWTLISTDHYSDAAGLCSWGCDQDGKLAIRMLRDENLLICQDGTNLNTLNEGTMSKLYVTAGKTRLVCRVWRKTCRSNVFFGWVERQNQWYSQGGSEAVRLRQGDELNDDDAEGILEYRAFTNDWAKWAGGAVGIRVGGYDSTSQLTLFGDYFLAFEVAGAMTSHDLPTELWAGEEQTGKTIVLESWGVDDFSVRTDDWRMRTSNDDANMILRNVTGDVGADCSTSMSATAEELTFGCNVYGYGMPDGDEDESYDAQIYFRRINTDEVDLVKWDSNPDNRQCRMILSFPVTVKGHEPLVKELTAGWRDHNTVRLSFLGHDRKGEAVTYTAKQYRIGESGTWTDADCDPPSSSDFAVDDPAITLDWNANAQLAGAEHDDVYFRIKVSDGLYTSEAEVGPFAVRFTDTHPTTVITHPDSPSKISPIPLTITFSEPVSELLQEELVVTGGTMTSFAGSGAVYTVEVTPDGQGEVTLQVPADVVQDIGGDGNAVSDLASVVYDTVMPQVTLSYAGESIITSGGIVLKIALSEPVVALTADSITVTNATLGEPAGGDLAYTIAIAPVRDGLFTCQIPAGVLHDAAGNENSASNAIWAILDAGPPSVTVSHEGGDLTNADTITFNIVFSEPVTGFIAEMLVLENGTCVELRGEDDTYAAVVTPLAPGEVSCHVPVYSVGDVAENPNTVSNTDTVTYTTDPSPAIDSWASVLTHADQGAQSIDLDSSKVASDVGASGPVVESRRGGVSLIQVRFSMAVEPVDGTLDANDVVVTDSDGTVVTATSLSMDTETPTLRITFEPALSNQERYAFDLAGKFASSVGLPLTGDADCQVRTLVGDVNSDGEVTLLDLAAAKDRNRQNLTPANARYDVNRDGLLDLIDAAIIRGSLEDTAP